MRKMIVSASVLMLSLIAAAAPLSSLRGLKSQTLPAGTVVEGVVISDCRSFNNALNSNIRWNKVNYADNKITAYIQAPDASCGIRIIFDSVYDNRLERGQSVSIDLSGCSLVCEKNPERYTVKGVRKGNVTVTAAKTVLPRKEKTIGSLEDSDVYTFVTVKDLEFLSKQGSFSNVYETAVGESSVNHTVVDVHLGCGDGWAQLLEDSQGRSIYMQVNSKCQWRRNNLGVPRGVGDVSGVLVCEHNRRYGVPFGKWSLRPIEREDIAIPSQEATSFKTVAAWRWDRNYSRALNLRDGGLVKWAGDISGDAVLSEEGNGLLYTDSACTMTPSEEYDTRYCTDGAGTGARGAAALRFAGRTLDWIHPGNNSAIIVETSTQGVSGKGLVFNFSMVAGAHHINSSFGNPAVWTVEYSTDGRKYSGTGYQFNLRPLAWSSVIVNGKGFIDSAYDAAIGFSEHSVILPSSLLGQPKLFVRIIPVGETITAQVVDVNENINSAKANAENDRETFVNLGMAVLKTF